MRVHRRTGAALALSFAALSLTGAAVAADSTVVVKSNALNGWIIQSDGTVPYAFQAGPAAIGAGSLQFGPIDGADPANKFIMFAPVSGLVADLASFSYDFFIAADSVGGAADADEFYLNLYVDSAGDGTAFYDCRYDSVPAAGAVAAWTTHAVTAAGPWANVAGAGCPATLDLLPAGSLILAIALNGGQSTSADAGVAGGYDNVVASMAGETTTYDFEALVGPPLFKADCKNGGWATFEVPGAFKNQGRCIQYVNTGKTHGDGTTDEDAAGKGKGKDKSADHGKGKKDKSADAQADDSAAAHGDGHGNGHGKGNGKDKAHP